VVVGTDHTGISLVNLTKRIVFQNIPTNGVSGVAFIDDRNFVYSSQDGSIHVRGGKSWTELISMQNVSTAINALAFSSNSDRLAVAVSDQLVTVWISIHDPDDMKLIGFTKLNDLRHNSAVNCLSFSPDGKMLLTGSEDGSVLEWDLVSFEGKATLTSFSSPVTSVAYSKEGTCIAAGSVNGEVRTICRNEGVIGGENTITVHNNTITELSFSPIVADLLATGSADKTIKLWRNFFELEADINQGSAIDRIVFTPDGKHLIIAWSNEGINTLTIWTIPYQQNETPTVYPLLTATPTRTPEPIEEPPVPTMISP
jgi:WD40 repeat protein